MTMHYFLESENVTFYGKRHFADVIKVKDLKNREIILDHLSGPNLITWAFSSRKLSWTGEQKKYAEWELREIRSTRNI